MMAVSLFSCEYCVESRYIWAEMIACKTNHLNPIILGHASRCETGKNIQDTKTCPGPNQQEICSEIDSGSHIDSSQTSLVLSGCARDSALSELIKSDKKRIGDDDAGDDCTRTRCADGVLYSCSTSASNKRYLRVRRKV